MATMPVADDFKEFLRLLNQEKVRYLLVGGYAVNYHGHSRRTDDLDLWVALSPENAERIVEVLYQFGFQRGSLSSKPLLRKGAILRMGFPPLRIELFTDIAGVEFDKCYERAIAAEIDGISVPVIDLASLLANKRATGRLKDLSDLEALTDATSPVKRNRKKSAPSRRKRSRGP